MSLSAPISFNFGYAALQLSSVLTDVGFHTDETLRQRAQKRIDKWRQTIEQACQVPVVYDNMQAFREAPLWVTLKTSSDGLTIDEWLASGPLLPYEDTLIQQLPFRVEKGYERLALNGFFLTEDGLRFLQELLKTGMYAVEVPEEAALLTIAWLVQHRQIEKACKIIDQILPWLAYLRFYPRPVKLGCRQGVWSSVSTVSEVIRQLQQLRPNQRILAQKEALGVWRPFKDDIVSFFLEAIENRCLCVPKEEWRIRAKTLLDTYSELKTRYTRCTKPHQTKYYFGQLLALLRCYYQTSFLSDERLLLRLQRILETHIQKHGWPEHISALRYRFRCLQAVMPVSHYELSQVLLQRLEQADFASVVDDPDGLTQAVTADESHALNLPEYAQIPWVLQKKARRCALLPIAQLVAEHQVTAAQMLEQMLPQIKSHLQLSGISEIDLRDVYAATYHAFHRHRALLSRRFKSQVHMHELPWIHAMDGYRREQVSERTLAQETLAELVYLTLTSFPERVFPHTLLQTCSQLAKEAGIDLPLVLTDSDGRSNDNTNNNGMRATKQAAALLRRSLYATYYHIPYEALQRSFSSLRIGGGSLFSRTFGDERQKEQSAFAYLCQQRVKPFSDVMGIDLDDILLEQQHILTTHNLAVLMQIPGVQNRLSLDFPKMARRCFQWICYQQQKPFVSAAQSVRIIAKTACAWRQMLFFLSLTSKTAVQEFDAWAKQYLSQQPASFLQQFMPIFVGFQMALRGQAPALIPEQPDEPWVFSERYHPMQTEMTLTPSRRSVSSPP